MEGSFEQVFSDTVTDGLALQIRQHMQNADKQYIMDFTHSITYIQYFYIYTMALVKIFNFLEQQKITIL